MADPRASRLVPLRDRVALSDTTWVNIRHLMRYSLGENGCWNWTGPKDRHGYGKVSIIRTDGPNTSTNAHRLYYTVYREPVDPSLQLDHLCRNTSCVNPEHLEPVTNGENVRRAIEATRPACPQGHDYTPENTKYGTKGERRCRTCIRIRDAAYKRKWRARHPELVAQRNRADYVKHREERILKQRGYNKAKRAAQS